MANSLGVLNTVSEEKATLCWPSSCYIGCFMNRAYKLQRLMPYREPATVMPTLYCSFENIGPAIWKKFSKMAYRKHQDFAALLQRG